ncbi:chemotaxis protein CheW [Rhodoferax sp. GW822-FHT02A01]|uniref:chemotaxis protein CheW n=1 Tax=Rhodoferax sp. GW822-FHT02A01 TaxID=3141537 RepID=UPI00315CBDE1
MQTPSTTSPDSSAARPSLRGGRSAQSNEGPSVPSEWLSFKLGDEEYGIDILSVQEIRSFEKPTRMTNMPAFVLGVLNLRGVIVPVLDMRVKFNLERVEYGELTVCIVLSIGHRTVGMVVDGVSDVVTLTPEQMRPVPEFSSGVGSEHLLSIGTLSKRLLMLIDIDKLMSSQEMGLVSANVGSIDTRRQ